MPRHAVVLVGLVLILVGACATRPPAAPVTSRPDGPAERCATGPPDAPPTPGADAPAGVATPGASGPAIQFDTKGVEFGPWIRLFVAQVKRTWFIPYETMRHKGHVVVTFNVHRDGRIADATVLGPSSVAAFNSSACNAILGSNPTAPLPTGYPADRAFFTVTFYYNEQPPEGRQDHRVQ